MKKTIEISLLPDECFDESSTLLSVQKKSGFSEITAMKILRKSLDARRKPIHYNLLVEIFVNEKKQEEVFDFDFKDVRNSNHAVIVGAGPAGLFAALKLLEKGIKPIIFERGKNVRERRFDLAKITKENIINPESNYCFGEGGAGTFSDGKLYTRSTKRGDVNRILRLLVKHGADERILYESHPHIGTNKLPKIIENIRETILHFGGEIHFNSKLADIEIENRKIKSVTISNLQTTTNDKQQTTNLILATGHSARDIFELLFSKNILIEAKPFALGVRIEHPQSLIDSIQYKLDYRTGSCDRGDYLPPANYSLVNQSAGHGVFSFCMCPGGIIAPAATSPGEIVVNGWSPSKRNNKYANSGLVVSVDQNELKDFEKFGALAAMKFQSSVEQKCFEITKSLNAPAQRMVDFLNKKVSNSLPDCSYFPGITSFSLDEVLPDFISSSLRYSLKIFGQKMKGYLTNEAVMVATESRTSSPVRIPRDKETLQHVQIAGLYPCGEGAGYAGGIVSSAIDGERCAERIS